MRGMLAAFLLLAVLALAVAGWLWGPPLWAEQRRARLRRRPFPAAWREILRHRMPYFARLPADLQLQLKKHIQVFVAEKPFVGCNGLEVTEEMRVLIAAQAGLLLLNRRAGMFRGLHQVLVYPGAFVVDRLQNDAAGLVRDGVLYYQTAPTPYGDYPYPLEMRFGVRSVTKSVVNR